MAEIPQRGGARMNFMKKIAKESVAVTTGTLKILAIVASYDDRESTSR